VSALIESERGRFGVEPICEALGVSASAYYRRASGERSARAVEDERLLGLIREIHERNYCAYGSWRMWKALERAGEDVGRSRVERLMRRNAIRGAKRRGKPWRTTISDPTAARPLDLVQRDFSASRPNELWVSDFERHEALSNRAVVEGHRLRLVAAGR
jgi:transposase InsO family protein